jgi:hypothetical protein
VGWEWDRGGNTSISLVKMGIPSHVLGEKVDLLFMTISFSLNEMTNGFRKRLESNAIQLFKLISSSNVILSNR